MLDIKYIRQEPEAARERLVARGEAAGRVDELLALDEKLRALVTEVETLQADRNAVSKEIGALMGQGKREEAEAKKTETRDIGDRIDGLNAEKNEAEAVFNTLLLSLPNLAHESVPVGADESANEEIKVHGEKPVFDFEPKGHLDICETLGLVDFERGTKIAGRGFLLYTGWGARLERAMIQFLLDLHVHEHGYTEVSPPFMVRAECMEGVGQFPKFLDQAYAVQEGLDAETLGKCYLIPTAEAPVANLHRGEILDENELPKYYCAYSPCFRAEAGAAGAQAVWQEKGRPAVREEGGRARRRCRRSAAGPSRQPRRASSAPPSQPVPDHPGYTEMRRPKRRPQDRYRLEPPHRSTIPAAIAAAAAPVPLSRA